MVVIKDICVLRPNNKAQKTEVYNITARTRQNRGRLIEQNQWTEIPLVDTKLAN